MLTGSNYGFFGDKFNTIALSKHLAFGWVDLPAARCRILHRRR
jgi:hypothetical protein